MRVVKFSATLFCGMMVVAKESGTVMLQKRVASVPPNRHTVLVEIVFVPHKEAPQLQQAQ